MEASLGLDKLCIWKGVLFRLLAISCQIRLRTFSPLLRRDLDIAVMTRFSVNSIHHPRPGQSNSPILGFDPASYSLPETEIVVRS